jgi:hypothetical protein
MKVNRRFEGTCRLHYHGRRISQIRNQHEGGTKLYAGFLLGLLFSPEDGGDTRSDGERERQTGRHMVKPKDAFLQISVANA